MSTPRSASDSDDCDSDASAASRWSSGSGLAGGSRSASRAGSRGGGGGGSAGGAAPSPKRKAPGGIAGLKAVGQAALRRQIEELMQQDMLATQVSSPKLQLGGGLFARGPSPASLAPLTCHPALSDDHSLPPFLQAAAIMGCSATTFRKLCRSVGIPRWPTRTRRQDGSGSDSE